MGASISVGTKNIGHKKTLVKVRIIPSRPGGGRK